MLELFKLYRDPDGNEHREYINGHKEWLQNDLLHREDGPAREYANGDKEWYQYGKLHRLDGPAIEWGDTKVWYQNGLKHRVNGPAVEYANGDQEWWQDGIYYGNNPALMPFNYCDYDDALDEKINWKQEGF